MLTYRAVLKPRSATLTPWQADTLFGHLCWLVRYEEGRQALDGFLAEFRDDPPLLFSNGFPGDWLPRPLAPVARTSRDRSKAEGVQAMRDAKADKGVRWVGLDQFNALRRGEEVVLAGPRIADHRTVLKNQINRLTFGTTPVDDEGGGNLYNADELAFVDRTGVRPAGLPISIYVKARDASWAGQAENLLRRLALTGYGAKTTAGYGHFELQDWQPFAGFDGTPAGANGFVGLSHWVPAAGDPADGFYTTMVKYGKLGQERARSANPFKFPLIMLTAGSAFYYSGAPARDSYGRLVENIAPAHEGVVQYAYAFAVPARLPDLAI